VSADTDEHSPRIGLARELADADPNAPTDEQVTSALENADRWQCTNCGLERFTHPNKCKQCGQDEFVKAESGEDSDE